jgi:hypothetical protein
MKPRHEVSGVTKTAVVKPVHPRSRQFIGPIKPDAKSAPPEMGKLSALQTNLKSPSFQKMTPGTFTPRPLRIIDTKCQTSNSEKDASNVKVEVDTKCQTSTSEKDASKVKVGSLSLQNFQKPTAVIPPNPVVSPVGTNANSKMANLVKDTLPNVVVQPPLESASNLAIVKPTGPSSNGSVKQESKHDKGNALGLLSGYESSDSDKSPSPARVAPATSTTSDGHLTSPDEQQETEITSQANKSEDIPEGPEPPVESSVQEADQSSESQLDKHDKEIWREKTTTKDKKKKKKHKKEKKSEKVKSKHGKGERERHGVSQHSSGDSKHKHFHFSDSSVVKGSRKRHSGDFNSSGYQPPHKEARTLEERNHRHRHRHHSLNSDSNDQGDRDELDSVHSHHGRSRSHDSEEPSDRHRWRRSDSMETSERHKSKKEKHHYSPSSPERTHSDRCFERKSVEKIRWEDTERRKDSHASSCSSFVRRDRKSYSHAISELTKSSLHGYGRSVQSWDGSQSHVDRAVDEDQRHGKRKRDPWDEEYDKGKVKKVKRHKQVTATMRDNALQKIQNLKNRLGVRAS